MKEFSEICNNGKLILHKHLRRHHYIIQINPAIERFIIDAAIEVGISLSDFNLPDDITLLTKESKTVNSKNDERFKRLFRALLAGNALQVGRLARWITYLKENNYSADVGLLKAM